jgi:hypothetical protein
MRSRILKTFAALPIFRKRNILLRPVSKQSMADLTSKTAIYVKAVLFLVIGATSAALLILQIPTLQTTLLLWLVIWSFCRAYYFAFYVIEHYVDPSFRFAGLFDFAKYMLRRK